LKLPHHNEAVIPEAKIVDYLLSPTHQTGGGKAGFFTLFGFSRNVWEELADALKEHAVNHEVTRVEASPFGTRYIVEGRLKTPTGRTPYVRVVWFTETGEDIPRLVTAYPVPNKEGEHDSGT
jgi:hypothetical protein